MSKFEMDISFLRQEEHQLASIQINLSTAIVDLSRALIRLRLNCQLKNSILEKKLEKAIKKLQAQRSNVYQLKKGLSDIIMIATATEKKGLATILGIQALREDAPFDDKGSYGGDQASPAKHRLDVITIVHNYFPEKNDSEVSSLLSKLNNEGCGYTACINSIIKHYEGRPQEFEDEFGFSMYTENGEYNFDALLTDFYCSTDNHHSIFGIDYENPFEDASDIDGGGMSTQSFEYRMESYLKKHGVKVDVKVNQNVTPQTFPEISKNNDVIIKTYPVKLIDESGKSYISDGGHAMIVTGVTEDGKYIVSSWGDKYYLDPSVDFSDLSYVIVHYQ